MDSTSFLILGIAIGVVVGIAVGLLLRRGQATNGQKMIDQAREALSSQAVTSFMDALTTATNQLVTVASSKLSEQQTQAAQNLEGKKALIDQTLATMNTELSKVQTTMQELKEKGENQFGGLTQQLADASLQTGKLTDITARLQKALASSQTRGQWGERMADDILCAAGFKEDVNYLKQKVELSGNRPDFTFLLPKNLRLNMDVKFPLDNYMSVVSAATDEERSSYTKKFLSDVQQRVKEINSREYVDPTNGTVDCVLLFIPVESVFAFARKTIPGCWIMLSANMSCSARPQPCSQYSPLFIRQSTRFLSNRMLAASSPSSVSLTSNGSSLTNGITNSKDTSRTLKPTSRNSLASEPASWTVFSQTFRH